MKNILQSFLFTAAFLFVVVNSDAQETKTITLGLNLSILSAPVQIAEHEGYFKEEGINIISQEFDSGKAALATMLAEGKLDMVTVSQTPIVFNSFTRNDFTIIACMVTSDFDVKILARKDHGILYPRDLKGKKVGLTKKSAGQFFLHRFLNQSGILDSAVEIQDIPTSKLSQALAEGQVDAISTWEPNISNAQKELGDQAMIISGKGLFREDFYFVANKKFLENNQRTVKSFLKAIQKAQDFIHNDKEKSIEIVSQRLKIEPIFVASAWDDFDFELTLDQTVLITLEDEARWVIKDKLVESQEMPDFLDLISLDELEDVNPDGVRLNH